MTAYSKLFAAIISTLLTRWLAQYFGLDVETLGVGPELQMLVSLAIDSGIAAVNGFFVWLLPNKQPTTPMDSAVNISIVEDGRP